LRRWCAPDTTLGLSPESGFRKCSCRPSAPQYRPRTSHTIAEPGHHPQRGPPEARKNPVSWSTVLGYIGAECVPEIEEVSIRLDIGTGGKPFRVSRTTERQSVSPMVRALAARSLLAGLQSRARLPALRQVL
jgi:hypothetical protein